MNQAVTLRNLLAGGLFLASSLTCDAMSLGRAKGVIWIGQPMDLSIQVRLEPGEDVSTICVAADVYFADTRVSSGQVRVFAESGDSHGEAIVRIRSTVSVDEPVVNVYLKAGCNQAMTRRYVLLAEVPVDYTTERAAPSFRGPSMAGARVQDALPPLVRLESDRLDFGRAAGTPVGPSRNIRIPRVRASTVPADSMIRELAAPVAVTRQMASPAPVRSVVRKPAPEIAAGKSRLKLDPADILTERNPILRASTELLTAPQEQDIGSRRAEAAALWRAINATPEAILGDARRVEALQTDAASLRIQNQRSEAAVADLKLRLQRAQDERFGNVLVYGLMAALVAALGAAGYFWSRSGKRAKEGQWWGSGDPVGETNGSQFGAPEIGGKGSSTSAGVQRADLDIDLDVGWAPQRREEALVSPPGLAALDGTDFQSSMTGAGRAVKVEELLDIQQQADFFLSLGQYDQAVATLRNHIADNVETSALAYLDLLKIYHLQGREKDYALVRKEFNDVFNAEVPEFAAFGRQTRGLESYQSAMSRITGLWPTPKVLEVIEESILRKPGQGRQVFDLEAYRELLMLYSIAKEIVEESGASHAFESSGTGLLASIEPGQRDDGDDCPAFLGTTTQPLPNAPIPADMAFKVPPSANLGLDIDLSEFASESSKLATTPAVTDTGQSTKPPDGYLVDFDIFDMATRSQAKSRRGRSGSGQGKS